MRCDNRSPREACANNAIVAEATSEPLVLATVRSAYGTAESRHRDLLDDLQAGLRGNRWPHRRKRVLAGQEATTSPREVREMLKQGQNQQYGLVRPGHPFPAQRTR